MTHLAQLRRSFPTPGFTIRWIGKTRRRITWVLLALLAIVAGPPLWWETQLIGLPDIGAPFDVASFRSSTVPDDRNAFVRYREAAKLLKPLKEYVKAPRTSVDLFARWSKADEQMRRLLMENRDALAIYRQGSERPDAFDPPPIVSSGDETLQSGLSFRVMYLLEASRLEDDQGDMAGAWGWYRAMVRTIHHVGMRGSVQRRHSIQLWYGQLHDRLAKWARQARKTSHAFNASARPSPISSLARRWLPPSRIRSSQATWM